MSEYKYNGKIPAYFIEEALSAYRQYKSDREPLIKRIRDDEEFYRRSYERTYSGIESNMQCDTPLIFAAIENCRADAIDNYPNANIIEREPEGTAVADLLSKVVEAQLEISDFKSVYKENMRNKLKYGTAVYGVFYDSANDSIDIRSIDILDIYVDMHIPDIEESRFVFISAAIENDLLLKEYPEFSRLFCGDAQVETLSNSYSLKERTNILDCYYKKPDGTVHLMKICDDVVIAATEDMPGYENGLYSHGHYPVVFDVLYPCEHSPFGFGMIDIGKSTQVEINKLDDAITENIMCASKPRYLTKRNGGINEDEFCDISKSIIHYEGDTDSIRAVDHQTINEYFLSHRECKKDELKELLANRDFQQGGTAGGVTAASAIETLRQAGEKRSRAIVSDSYDSFKWIVYMVIELMRQFFTEERVYRVSDPMGKKSFAKFSNSMLYKTDYSSGRITFKKLMFDIDVVVQRENPYSRENANNTILQLWSSGIFNPDNKDCAIVALKNMQFDGKERLISDLQTLYESEVN